MSNHFESQFNVRIGNFPTIPVGIEGADSLEDAALQAAVAAWEQIKVSKVTVFDLDSGYSYTFSQRDIEEFWA